MKKNTVGGNLKETQFIAIRKETRKNRTENERKKIRNKS